MIRKKIVFVLPLAVLLFLSLISTASTVGTRVNADSTGGTQSLTVYIQSLKPSNGSLSVIADEIDWYQGERANQIFAEREPEAYSEIGGALDDYYIVNDSDTLTTYKVADNADVSMQLYDHGTSENLDIHWNEKITLQHFIDQFAKTDVIDLSQFPYHLTIKNGVITSIVQQYIP